MFFLKLSFHQVFINIYIIYLKDFVITKYHELSFSIIFLIIHRNNSHTSGKTLNIFQRGWPEQPWLPYL